MLLSRTPGAPAVFPLRNSDAVWAEPTTSTCTGTERLRPNWAPKTLTPTTALVATPDVTYSSAPLSSCSPAKLAVLAMRVIESMALST